MNVQGVGHTSSSDSRPGSARVKAYKPGASKSLFSISDTVELSGKPADRGDFINQVKMKVKAGYYSSEPVMEDLSHGFARMLHQL